MTRKEYIDKLNKIETLVRENTSQYSEFINISYISLIDIEAIIERELTDEEIKHGLDVLHNCDTTSMDELHDYLCSHKYFKGVF